MKRMRTKKKLIALNMGVLMLTSILIYPIFATGEQAVETTSENINVPEITQNEEQENTNLKSSTPVATSEQSRAVGDKFEAKIYNNGVQNLDCIFKVLTLPNGDVPGEVETCGEYYGWGADAAISKDTIGTIAIPNQVSDSINLYKVTKIGDMSFYECEGLTNTGIENNTSIEAIGTSAYEGCTGLTKTGLEKNKSVRKIASSFQKCINLESTGLEENATVKEIGSAFRYCRSLENTGLEKNRTITTIGDQSFASCTSLKSTGLEKNTTLTVIGNYAFENCVNLEDIVFEITTLPIMRNVIFQNAGVNIYYLPETTNPEVLNSTGAVSVNEIALESIRIKTGPTKTEYIEEQTFDPSGLEIVAKYNYGDKEIVYNDSTKNSFNFNPIEVHLKDKSVEITYGGKSTTQPITVKEKSITNIKVKAKPTKVDYIEEENFDPTGLVLTLNYDNGKSEDITYDNSTKGNFGFDKTEVKLGDSSITISYGGKSTTQAITVKEKSVTIIKVNTKPTKVNYIEEEAFNATGLVLTVNYDNGKSEDITYSDSTKGNFSFDKTEVVLGDNSIEITYGGKSTTQAITVKEKSVTNIKVKVKPTKVNYIEEENFDPTGLVLTVSYDNGKSEDITYNDSTKGNFSFDKTEVVLGDKSIEITYGGKSTTQAITVKEKSVIDIKVKVKPTKVKYIEREDFEADGLVLTVYYDNGKSEDITYSDSTKDDFSFDITIVNYRDTEIVITYKGKTVSQAIEVEAKPIKEIEVKAKPNKVEYIEGTVFDPTGMNITVNYEDGDSAIIPYNEKTKVDFVFAVKKWSRMLQRSNEVVLGLEDSEIEVIYRNEATGILQVKVNKKEITKISIKIEPSKVEYLEGETFAPEGLVLEISYNNGTSEEVVYEESNKEDFIFDKKELRKEDKSIKITYLGKIVELAIKVEVPAEIVVPDKGTEEKVVDTRDTMEILPYLVLSAIASVGILLSKLRKESI